MNTSKTGSDAPVPIRRSKRYGDQMHGDEIETIYVDDSENPRFIVSLVVGFCPYWEAEAMDALAAAHYAWDLTRDDSCDGTHWCVFDRHTGQFHMFEQYEIEGDTQASRSRREQEESSGKSRWPNPHRTAATRWW